MYHDEPLGRAAHELRPPDGVERTAAFRVPDDAEAVAADAWLFDPVEKAAHRAGVRRHAADRGGQARPRPGDGPPTPCAML